MKEGLECGERGARVGLEWRSGVKEGLECGERGAREGLEWGERGVRVR